MPSSRSLRSSDSSRSSRTLLVYLANGVQGAAVVRAALAHGFRVRALVRDRRSARRLEALGAEAVTGDLRDAASLHRASLGVDHVVLQVPLAPIEDMTAQARNAVDAALACRVRGVILKLASASRPAPCAEPSLVANASVEDVVRRSGLPFAIVRPTLYLDNLLKPSARREIAGPGIFAPPIAATQAIAWTCVDDCADAAVTLIERGAMGGDHRIAGPESLDGNALARRLSDGLGRPVVYRAQEVDAFEREIDMALGPGAGRPVASKFRYFAAHAHEAASILAAPFSPLSELRDWHPTPAEAWMRRHREAFDGGPATA